MKLLVLLVPLIPLVVAMNIVLSTADSWVSKNARYLLKVLQEDGHNVILIGNLYEYQSKCKGPNFSYKEDGYSAVSIDPIRNGGAYGHLLPVHQTYFKSMNHIVREHKPGQHQRRAKKVLFFSKDEKALIDQQHDKNQLYHRQHHWVPFQTDFFGQDPLDRDAWYVNNLGPHSLIFGLDVILPRFYDGMNPDLIIMGPSESPASDESVFDALQYVKQREQKGLKAPTVLTIATNDDNSIYFQDETYFNVQTESYEGSIKSNVVTKTLQFINRKVLDLIYFETFEKSRVITLSFPILNLESHKCSTDEDDISFKRMYTSVISQKQPESKLNSNLIPVFKFDGPHDVLINLNAWKSLLTSRDRWNYVITSARGSEHEHLENCDISVHYLNFE